MSSKSHRFRELLAGIRSGSQESARLLVEEFGPPVLRAVRRRLRGRMRIKFDSQDFMQAMWMSVFEDEFVLSTVHAPDELVNLLCKIAQNKVIDEYRRLHQTQKHDVTREYSLDGSAEFTAAGLQSPSPSASAVFSAKERWHTLVRNQDSRNLRILELRSSGVSYQEIADVVGVNERTVRRVLDRAYARVDEQRAD